MAKEKTVKRTVLWAGICRSCVWTRGFILILVIFGRLSPQASLGQGAVDQAPQSEKTADHEFVATIKSKMPTLLDTDSVPGAAIALIRHGEVVWTEGFGWANVAGKIRATPETIFNVGSISKTPTAWAVMQLVQQGKIGLDQPIDTYLTRWHLPPSAFDSKQVTVRRLLSHTSGISNHDYHGWDPASPLPPIEDSLAGKTGTGQVQIVYQPGSEHRYSGANYAILELLLEEKSGQLFEDYMQSHIFRPLHMDHTRYGLPSADKDLLATAYDSLGKPLPILRYNELAAAGLTTNVRDLALFAAAGLSAGKAGEQGRGVLTPNTVQQMETAIPGTKWADMDPFGPDPQYGLGYTVRPSQFAGHTGVGHGGSNNGWESLIQIIPETNDGIVIMTNSSNGSAVVASVLCEWRRWAAKSGTSTACPTIEVRIPLLSAYKAGGVTRVVSLYRKLRQEEAESYDFSSPELNSMGYQVMRLGDVAGAVEIFKLNVEEFPGEWNVYDSLGEAELKLGDKPDAILNYRKSLELNPKNDNGRDVLRSLGVS
jgi:CubicO group peptidase (beta-lactamase class C family)